MKVSEQELNVFIEKLTNTHSDLASMLLDRRSNTKRISKEMNKVSSIITALIALKEMIRDDSENIKNY